MAILLDETTEVVVQGATGKEGQFRIQVVEHLGDIGPAARRILDSL